MAMGDMHKVLGVCFIVAGLLFGLLGTIVFLQW